MKSALTTDEKLFKAVGREGIANERNLIGATGEHWNITLLASVAYGGAADVHTHDRSP